jgi:hypothetical protein
LRFVNGLECQLLISHLFHPSNKCPDQQENEKSSLF